jgi:hypothetical protein
VHSVDGDAAQFADLEGAELIGADEVVDGAAADVQRLGRRYGLQAASLLD